MPTPDRFAASVVETRRKAFERILQAAAENAALRRSDAVQRFLTTGLPTMDRTGSSGSAISSDSAGGSLQRKPSGD